MTVPSSHPELRALLAALIRGDDVAFALHDWLMERGDERAAHVRAFMEKWWGFTFSFQAHGKFMGNAIDFLHPFGVSFCHTCHVLDANDLHTGCQECGGLGWSQLFTSYRVPCKVERWQPCEPYRESLLSG